MSSRTCGSPYDAVEEVAAHDKVEVVAHDAVEAEVAAHDTVEVLVSSLTYF